MKILDATCGAKSIWYQKNHPLVTYLDIRKGNFIHWNKKTGKKQDTVRINPDIVGDFANLDFCDNNFDMILFDPPHFIRDKDENNEITLIKRYGYLPSDSWKQILKNGINELFRVLKPEGVFIFKWTDTDNHGIVKELPTVTEIVSLFPYKPIFGSRNIGSKIKKTNLVYWLVFLKYDVNIKLDEYQ